MPKGNEELKAKIAKIQQKGKKELPPLPTPPQVQEEPQSDEDMKALEAEFEEKKKALMQKSKASPATEPSEPQEEGDAEDAGLEQAIAEYSEEGKFRVELVFQLVQLNKSMKEIADTLKKFADAND